MTPISEHEQERPWAGKQKPKLRMGFCVFVNVGPRLYLRDPRVPVLGMTVGAC